MSVSLRRVSSTLKAPEQLFDEMGDDFTEIVAENIHDILIGVEMIDVGVEPTRLAINDDLEGAFSESASEAAEVHTIIAHFGVEAVEAATGKTLIFQQCFKYYWRKCAGDIEAINCDIGSIGVVTGIFKLLYGIYHCFAALS